MQPETKKLLKLAIKNCLNAWGRIPSLWGELWPSAKEFGWNLFAFVFTLFLPIISPIVIPIAVYAMMKDNESREKAFKEMLKRYKNNGEL